MVEASTPTIGREEKGEGAGLGGKYARFGSSVPIIYNSQSVTLGLLCINELTSKNKKKEIRHFSKKFEQFIK